MSVHIVRQLLCRYATHDEHKSPYSIRAKYRENTIIEIRSPPPAESPAEWSDIVRTIN